MKTWLRGILWVVCLMFLAITAFSQPIEGVNTIYEVMTDWDRLVDVSIQGDYAYFADWEWGMSVYDISDLNRVRYVSRCGIEGLKAYDIEVQDNLAFLSIGSNDPEDSGFLNIIDISDPLDPQQMSSIELNDHFAREAIVDEDIVYVKGENLYVINIANPEEPEILEVFEMPVNIDEMCLIDDLMLLTGDFNEQNGMRSRCLRAINVENPAEPEFLGELNHEEDLRDIAVFGNLAYVTSGGGDCIQIISIEDPENLALAGSIWIDWPKDICISGNFAYISNNGRDNSMTIMDLENPLRPAVIEAYFVDNDISSIFIQEDIAILPMNNHGCEILDIADRRNPQPIYEFDRHGLNVKEVHYTQNYVVTNWLLNRTYSGFQVFDISNLNQPEIRCQYGIDRRNIWYFEVVGNFLYGYDSRAGFTITDFSNLDEPEEVSSWRSFDFGVIRYFKIENLYAFLSMSNIDEEFYDHKMVILDLENPREPVVAGSCDIGVGGRVQVSNGMAYCRTDDRMDVIDVSNPNEPEFQRTIDIERTPSEYIVQQGIAYFACNDAGLYVEDVSDPEDIERLCRFNPDFNIQSIFLVDTLMFVADSQDNGGFYVIDMSDFENPEVIIGHETFGIAQDICVIGDTIFVANTNNLGIYNLIRQEEEENFVRETLPQPFGLSSVYPNPFNSTTAIEYALPFASDVSVSIYNIHGQIVDVLLDRVMSAGVHSVVWDADEVSTGVYFINLSSKTKSTYTKVVLCK